MAAAAETFRALKTARHRDVRPDASQCSATSRRRPSPSEPMTRTTGRSSSTASNGSAAPASSPTARQPGSANCSSARDRLVTRACGSRSIAPAAALANAPASAGACRSCSTTPRAPKARGRAEEGADILRDRSAGRASGSTPSASSPMSSQAHRFERHGFQHHALMGGGGRQLPADLAGRHDLQRGGAKPPRLHLARARSGGRQHGRIGVARAGFSSAATTACQPHSQTAPSLSDRGRGGPRRAFRAGEKPRSRLRLRSLRSGKDDTIRRAPFSGLAQRARAGSCPERLRGRTVNPLAYAFAGSSPASPTTAHASQTRRPGSEGDQPAARRCGGYS